jgi:DNA-binding beta-propeller fold protein YncE
VVLQPGTLIVADREAFDGSGGVIGVDPSNGQQTPLSRGGMLVEPVGVAVSRDGRLFVTDLEAFGNGGLIAIDVESGEQTMIAASTIFRRPFGIDVDADGQIVVGYMARQQGSGAVMRVNPTNGEHHAVAVDVRFNDLTDVVVDGNSVVVADADISGIASRVHRVTEGVGASVLVDKAPGGSVLTGVAIESDGMIIAVSNSIRDEKQLLRFHRTSGQLLKVFEGRVLKAPFGIAIEANGMFVVADVLSGIVRIDPQTGVQTTVTSGGHLAQPMGIDVQP